MDATSGTVPRPPTRTYKQRRGRIGPTKAAALSRLLPVYGVEVDGPALDVDDLFGGRPVVLEIGCGHGEATVAAAQADPGTGLLAVDVHLGAVGSLISAVEAHHLDNVRVVHGDALTLLRRRVAPGSLAGARVFFPDPWPKARHHKRRLIDPATLRLLADRCRPGALLHVATDDDGYAEAIAAALDAEAGWSATAGDGAAGAPARATTRFEAAALAAGRPVHELLARRV